MMQFTFMDMAGTVLFVRDDAERAQWTTEEMTLDMDFPFVDGKEISTGQRVFFVDHNGEHQVYEIKTATSVEPEHYQQITAENICISELSDEHMDSQEVTDQTAKNALAGILTGTLWAVGTVKSNPVSSVDLSRGSVWQAVLQIKQNFNVYIEPRLTVNADGSITRRLDILPTGGEWRGVRLSINKNLLDPSVTYDDSELVTALYGYGGSIPSSDPETDPEEVTFADVVWQATSEHPAKPSGQIYLEDPTATAAFGRAGRARYGFYQNSNITDPETLLLKTWETLKTTSTPAISIDGTVEDLRRMGYADQPINLHDIAIVEVDPVGFKKQLQIIKLTVDLLDPSGTIVTIGAYIPNIIYIQRDTEEQVTGSRGGGGGGKNKSKEPTWNEFRTRMNVYADQTGMQIIAVQNDVDNQAEEIAVQTGRIDVLYNKIELEVTDRRNADNILQGKITVEANRITQEVTRATTAEGNLSGRITVESNRITQEVTRATSAESTLSGRITTEADRITAEVTRATGAESTLSGRITTEADRITAEVTRATGAENTLSGRITVNTNKIALVVTETSGGYTVNSAEIVAGINGQTGSYVKIKADTINLSGYVTASELEVTNAKISNLTSGATTASSLKTNLLSASTGFTYQSHSIGVKNVTINGTTYHLLGY